ncbi:MAG: hypothetical protein ACLFRG_16560 [Desulfococcaceae bacterium]
MKPILKIDIPFEIDVSSIRKNLEAEEKSLSGDSPERLAAEAKAVGRPKFWIHPQPVSKVGENTVRLGDHTFTSRAMAFHFSGLERVFPYLATAGTEMADWVDSLPEPEKLYADRMAEAALAAALSGVEREIRERFGIESIARINPGSLVDWALEEQRILFSLLGDGGDRIGVALAENLLMFPLKSGSGIVFPDETGFVTCRLCQVSGCRLRRAPFEPGRYERVYGTAPPSPPSF